MTPSHWMLDDVAGLLFGLLFGGLLLWVVVGVLIGRFLHDGVLAIGITMGGWGLSVLAGCVVLAGYIELDTVTRELPAVRCTPGPETMRKPHASTTYRLDRAGQEPVLVQTPLELGRCPDNQQPLGSDWVRLRKDRLASTAATIDGEEANERPLVMGAIFGAFGLAGLAAAALLLGPRLRNRQLAAAAPMPTAERTPPARWRGDVGRLIGWLGTMLFAAAFVAPWFVAGPVPHAVAFGLVCVAAAFATWAAGGLVAGTMTGVGFFFMAFFGGTMFVLSLSLRASA